MSLPEALRSLGLSQSYILTALSPTRYEFGIFIMITFPSYKTRIESPWFPQTENTHGKHNLAALCRWCIVVPPEAH